MADSREPVRVAVNIMRARLTVVGFNLAIITFQLSAIRRLPGGVQLPNLDWSFHVESDIALLMAMGLSILAMVSFIASSNFDQQGTCSHWSLLSGDLLMYSGLAHSVAGLFSPIATLFGQTTLSPADQMADLATVRTAIVIVGGLAWFGAAYVGPAVSLLRSPFGWRATTALGVAYLLLLLLLAQVSAQAVRLEAARAGIDAGPPPTLLNELLQPLRW